MQVSKETIFKNNKNIEFTHITNGSSVVCFMFSGAGYTYEKPLLYYSTMTMLQNKYDVVHIHYTYDQDIFKFPLEDIGEILIKDVNPVVTEILKQNQYKELIFLGKSLGTFPIIKDFMKDELFINSKMILLTPLLDFDSIYESLMNCNHSALIVIGDKDSHYRSERIEALIERKPTIKIEIVPNTNHQLDNEPLDTLASILIMKKVMSRLEDFLKYNLFK
ncbi:alpha/beta hydrolase [Bacillus sp. 1NLA3E]|uniref:alpha/beta hydrolase n=1 Tax=Bacillus sp. 1NLA3E TaxID=666686 RepID=UPI000247E46B|nr:alpha/beta hydrolase [Bacillus sp. 1NLA3E]AGK54165.1 hypothetical protein B1NLA3E_12085 [Bacillus sp. 1NLA3E]